MEKAYTSNVDKIKKVKSNTITKEWKGLHSGSKYTNQFQIFLLHPICVKAFLVKNF